VFQRGRYQIPLPIRCRPGFGARNSAAGQFDQIVLTTMIYNTFLALRGSFLVERCFSLPTGKVSGWPDLAAS
jgi:hypothetical protein